VHYNDYGLLHRVQIVPITNWKGRVRRRLIESQGRVRRRLIESQFVLANDLIKGHHE